MSMKFLLVVASLQVNSSEPSLIRFHSSSMQTLDECRLIGREEDHRNTIPAGTWSTSVCYDIDTWFWQSKYMLVVSWFADGHLVLHEGKKSSQAECDQAVEKLKALVPPPVSWQCYDLRDWNR
jgi:hypothetical protein